MEAEFYLHLLDSLTDGVYFVDQQRQISYWNKAAERLSGYSAAEVIGRCCADNLLRHVDDNGRELCLQGCPLAATINDGQLREAAVYMHHKFGHRVPVFVRAAPMRDNNGRIIGAVEIFSHNGKNLDFLAQMQSLRQEVVTDPLTGVGNRRCAEITLQRLDQMMAESKVTFGILFVDIDHFKRVNDKWGHHVGDNVLTMVARTIAAQLRPLDLVCRWGGEEFVVLIPNITAAELLHIAQRLRMLVKQSWFDLDDTKIQVTVSIGGALSADNEPAHNVLDRADQQLYRSKQSGRDCCHIA